MKTLQIAVGIIRNSDNQTFITQRAADAHMANKWEFPGGKIEAGCGHGRETGAEVRIILPDIGVNARLFPIINCHCRCIAPPKCAS